MTLIVNCDDTAFYDSRTLAQLRQYLIDGLGFLSPLTGYTPRTLLSLRTDVMNELGTIAPMANIATRSLTNLLADMMPMMGWGSIAASPPPGANAILTGFLNDAQQTLWRSIELDKGTASLPALLVNGSDTTTLDYIPVLNMALGLAKQFYKQSDADLYLGAAKKYLDDTARRQPPNIVAFVNTALQSAQQTVYRVYEVGNSGTITINSFVNDTDTTTVDPQPVFLLAVAELKARLDQKDAPFWYEQYKKFMADSEKRSPANLISLCNRFLKDAQERLYHQYAIFRTERWYTWTQQAGVRFYGIGSNDEQTGSPVVTKVLDPRHITWAGVSNGDNNWRPLRKGIPPGIYNGTQTGPSTHYEVRQTIEVWPLPITGWMLRIKGTFGLLSFSADSDNTTMDWQAVYLQALADAKEFYKQPDAPQALQRVRAYIAELVAGSHAGNRYMPGINQIYEMPAVRPLAV